MNQHSQVKLYFQYNSNRFKHPRISLTDYRTGIETILSINDCEYAVEYPRTGAYQIGVKLLDKTDSDTVVDSQGNIVDDLWVQLIKLEIDNIDITNKIDCISTYSDNQGHPVKTYGFLGFNNEYLLHLQTPGFYFIRNLSSIQPDDFKKWYDLFAADSSTSPQENTQEQF